MANSAIRNRSQAKLKSPRKHHSFTSTQNTTSVFCIVFRDFWMDFLGINDAAFLFFRFAVKPPMGFTTARRRRENKKTVCLWHLLKDDVVGSNTCYIQDNWQNIRQLSCETRMTSCFSGIEYKLSFGRAPHHRFFHYNLGLECLLYTIVLFFYHIQLVTLTLTPPNSQKVFGLSFGISK